MMRGATVAEALDGAVVAIAASGSDTPRLDAELLLAHALGVQRTALHLHPEAPVEGPAMRAYQDLVRRRSAGHEPVAYLIGRRGFRHIELDVDRRVLIPRPETELVVEAVLARAPQRARVLDVGTGSGAIALALKHERPDLDVTGSDISPDALDVARANGARLALDVTWVQADLIPALPAGWALWTSTVHPQGAHPGGGARGWDVVVSNPPYVRDDERLMPDVGDHEPALALRGGPDGLDVVRRLLGVGAPLLVLELGEGQAQDVVALAAEAGFAGTEVLTDLAGVERVVVAWT